MKTTAFFLLPLIVACACAGQENTPKRVALVFDDGPVPANATPLVMLLQKEGVHATFSLVGDRVAEHPEAAKALVDAGMEGVNHSQAHAHPADLSDSQLDAEVASAQSLITKSAGKAPRWYWPPFLEKNDRVYASVKKAGLSVYEPLHLVVSKDYDTTVSAAEILRLATTDVRDGTVILFHEWRKETLQQLPAVLAELRRQNCRFMTFSELADSLAAQKPASSP